MVVKYRLPTSTVGPLDLCAALELATATTTATSKHSGWTTSPPSMTLQSASPSGKRQWLESLWRLLNKDFWRHWKSRTQALTPQKLWHNWKPSQMKPETKHFSILILCQYHWHALAAQMKQPHREGKLWWRHLQRCKMIRRRGTAMRRMPPRLVMLPHWQWWNVKDFSKPRRRQQRKTKTLPRSAWSPSANTCWSDPSFVICFALQWAWVCVSRPCPIFCMAWMWFHTRPTLSFPWVGNLNLDCQLCVCIALHCLAVEVEIKAKATWTTTPNTVT